MGNQHSIKRSVLTVALGLLLAGALPGAVAGADESPATPVYGEATATVNGKSAVVVETPDGVTITASASSSQGGSSDAGVMAQSTISCTFRIDNPHHSTHFPDTWNVQATLTCSGYNNGNVTYMYSSAAIGLNGQWQLVWAPTEAWNHNNVTDNSAQTCRPGQIMDVWRGRALGYALMPPAFDPPQLHFEVESGAVVQGTRCGAGTSR